MRSILRDMRSGEVKTLDVPAPELRPGGILVRTAFSAISAGTERAKVQVGEQSLLGKALARPDLVRQVVDIALAEGVKAAYQRVQSRLDPLLPLGYSTSGVVTACGEGVQQFHIGDRVACAGGGYANHSEINFIPCNLAAHVPDSVPLDAASLTTIGAIALHGVRQGQIAFGETVAIIGTGLVGIMAVLLAKAAGCRVIAIDVSPGRVQRAREFGADLSLLSNATDTSHIVKDFTRHGVDAAIVTAATSSAEPIKLGAEIARDRGRIVIVGNVGMGVSREVVYHKELSITLSRSYGPGRYDPQYEEDGIDYPIGYVRWTEKRNMEAFLHAIGSRSIDVSNLIDRRYPVDEGGRAYAALRESDAYTFLIEYPSAPVVVACKRPVASARRRTPISGEVRVGCIGAGSFAKNVVFPALRAMRGCVLESVASASGIAAQSAARSFRFHKALNPSDLVADPSIDAVFVLSRHQSHADYVLAAMRNQKAVFVEKPLAITREQITRIKSAHASAREGAGFIMVGFNRRFAPMTVRMSDFFSRRQEPMMFHARVNAGYIPPDHWTQSKTEGGRIIGEFCHFIDLARSVIGSPLIMVAAQALPDGDRYNRDNVSATLTFADGSIANLLYLANGDKSVSKEHYEVFCENRVAILDDFVSLELFEKRKIASVKSKRDKGHTRELELTIEAIRIGAASPISYDELIEVSEACLAVNQAISTGKPVSIPLEQVKDAQEMSLDQPEHVSPLILK